MKITISGPAGAGKGTIARKLAMEAGFDYVDLGLLFRLGAFALASGKISDLDEILLLVERGDILYLWDKGTATVYWNRENVTTYLLSQETARQTSILATGHREQEKLLAITNGVLGTCVDVVCDGRNAGTTILPDADHKFFVTASLKERARRRYVDIVQRGGSGTYEEVLREIAERDTRDTERVLNPFVMPKGATVVETDNRSIEESVSMMLQVIDRR